MADQGGLTKGGRPRGADHRQHWFAVADRAVSTAGAGTVAEATADRILMSDALAKGDLMQCIRALKRPGLVTAGANDMAAAAATPRMVAVAAASVVSAAHADLDLFD